MSDLTPAQVIAKGGRAKAALEEFVAPSFEKVRTAYYDRLKHIVSAEPWEVEKIKALVTAIRIAEEAEAQIVAIVRDGDMARAEAQRIEKIASIPEAKRRLIL